jgi:serine/threonine protein kinase
MLRGDSPESGRAVLYACKVVPTARKNPRQIVEMEREVEILRQLNHPNIIRLHCSLKTTNNLYLFTDYCD